MLDATTDLDWDMWDSQINSSRTQPYNNWSDENDDANAALGLSGYNVRYGNAATGGTGPVSLGNGAENNGVSPTSFQYSSMNFDPAMMEDIDVGTCGLGPGLFVSGATEAAT